jgi:hypothetical protein
MINSAKFLVSIGCHAAAAAMLREEGYSFKETYYIIFGVCPVM